MQEKVTTLDPEHRLTKDFESLKKDLGRVSADVALLTKSLLEEGRQRTATTREKIGAEAQKRWSQVGDGVEKVKSAGKTGADKLEVQIKEHPLASVGVAFGVGIIIGQLLRR